MVKALSELGDGRQRFSAILASNPFPTRTFSSIDLFVQQSFSFNSCKAKRDCHSKPAPLSTLVASPKHMSKISRSTSGNAPSFVFKPSANLDSNGSDLTFDKTSSAQISFLGVADDFSILDDSEGTSESDGKADIERPNQSSENSHSFSSQPYYPSGSNSGNNEKSDKHVADSVLQNRQQTIDQTTAFSGIEGDLDCGSSSDEDEDLANADDVQLPTKREFHHKRVMFSGVLPEIVNTDDVDEENFKHSVMPLMQPPKLDGCLDIHVFKPDVRELDDSDVEDIPLVIGKTTTSADCCLINSPKSFKGIATDLDMVSDSDNDNVSQNVTNAESLVELSLNNKFKFRGIIDTGGLNNIDADDIQEKMDIMVAPAQPEIRSVQDPNAYLGRIPNGGESNARLVQQNTPMANHKLTTNETLRVFEGIIDAADMSVDINPNNANKGHANMPPLATRSQKIATVVFHGLLDQCDMSIDGDTSEQNQGIGENKSLHCSRLNNNTAGFCGISHLLDTASSDGMSDIDDRPINKIFMSNHTLGGTSHIPKADATIANYGNPSRSDVTSVTYAPGNMASSSSRNDLMPPHWQLPSAFDMPANSVVHSPKRLKTAKPDKQEQSRKLKSKRRYGKKVAFGTPLPATGKGKGKERLLSPLNLEPMLLDDNALDLPNMESIESPIIIGNGGLKDSMWAPKSPGNTVNEFETRLPNVPQNPEQKYGNADATNFKTTTPDVMWKPHDYKDLFGPLGGPSGNDGKSSDSSGGEAPTAEDFDYQEEVWPTAPEYDPSNAYSHIMPQVQQWRTQQSLLRAQSTLDECLQNLESPSKLKKAKVQLEEIRAILASANASDSSSRVNKNSQKSYDVKHSDPWTHDLRSRVRTDVLNSLKITPDNPEGMALIGASKQEVAFFEANSSVRNGPNLESLKLDMNTDKGVRNAWNKLAARMLTKELIAREPQEYNMEHFRRIQDAFLVYFGTIKKKYLEAREPQTEAMITSNKINKVEKAVTIRSRSLRTIRASTAGAFDSDPTMKRLSTEVWPKIPPGAMSIDGDYQQTGSFAVLIDSWKSEEVTDFMVTHDRLHLAQRYNEKNYGRGRFPRRRVRIQTGSSKRGPPRGLPINFFKPEYLSGLDEYTRDKLKIQPPVDMTISPRCRKIANRFKLVKSRHDRPLAIEP